MDIADVLFIAQYLVGVRGVGDDPATEVNAINAASVNYDNSYDVISIADALFLAQYLVGLRDACFGGTQGNQELQVVQAAVNAMMVENGLSAIPNPVSANTAPCATGTQHMNAYPDDSSVVSTADKLTDPNGNAYTDDVDPLGDKDGYLLFGHDITGDNVQAASTLVDYVSFDTTTYCYTIDVNGTVTAYDPDGTALATGNPPER